MSSDRIIVNHIIFGSVEQTNITPSKGSMPEKKSGKSVVFCQTGGAQWANLGLQAVELNQSVFCYRTPDFVNGPFVALDHIFDLAPSDRFLNFSFPSYGVSPSGLRPKNLHFFTLHPYNPHFLGSDGSDPTGS